MVHSTQHLKISDSPKVEVGEIDTRAPFQSVKDAVNLFGEVAFSGGRPAIKKANPNLSERVLAKETGLHLAQKELNKLKEQLKHAENTKSGALVELEKAKRTVENLSQKIKVLSASKEAAVQATEAAKIRAKQLEDANGENSTLTNGFPKNDPQNTRETYTVILSELNATKQVLAKIRQDFDTSVESKASATKQTSEAEQAAKVNAERASEISKEIASLKETIEQVRQASLETQSEQAKIVAKKDVEKQSYRSSLEESTKKLQLMKQEIDPEVSKNLESQLAEAISQTECIKRQIERARASDLDSVKCVTLELDSAKDSLQQVLEEGNTLQSRVDSHRQELEKLKKEHTELKEKEAETESIAGNLHIQLQKYKSDLEYSIIEEIKSSGSSDEMFATLNQLVAETEKARHEADEMKIKAAELKREAKPLRVCLEEAEQKLQVALQEAEVAKAAEAQALKHIQSLSEQADAARSSTSESGANITISKDEFEALTRKVEESEKLAVMKVAAAMAQVEAVKASENEALRRLDAARIEIEDMQAATDEALRKAEMAEAAKMAVEGELRRWREREQKKAAETASRILAETQSPAYPTVQTPPRTNSHLLPTKSATFDYKTPNASGKANGGRRLDKVRTSMSKKVLLPSLSGIFHKKRSP